MGLLHIFVDGLAEIVDGLLVALLGGVDDAVLEMVLEDDFAGVVDGTAHGGDLDQNLGTVAAFLHHAAHGLQMADGAAEPVEYGLGVLVGMGMAVGTVAVRVVMFVHIIMIVVMAVHVVVLVAVLNAQTVHQLVGLFGGGNIVEMFILHGVHLFAMLLFYDKRLLFASLCGGYFPYICFKCGMRV